MFICQKYLPLHQETIFVMETTVKATPAQVKQAVADYFKEHGLTMAEAGLKMNMSRASVSYALSMQDKYFTRAQAVKYAHYFHMSMDYLTQGEGELLAPGAELSEMMEKVVERNDSGTVIPKQWKEQMLQHEERRYNKAVSDLSDLETILKLLESAIMNGEYICKRCEASQGKEPYTEGRMLRARQRISEYDKARAYIFEKLSSVRRIISDIEEKRFRRQHPELEEKTDDKSLEKPSFDTSSDPSHFFFFFDFDKPDETGDDEEQ